MQGVPFRVDGKGRVLISWMSEDRAYWSLSNAEGKRFAPRIPTPAAREGEAFPIALSNRKGEVLLVWKQNQQVHWAVYQQDGSFTGQQGQAGELPGRNKPAAFVGADDRFFVVF